MLSRLKPKKPVVLPVGRDKLAVPNQTPVMSLEGKKPWWKSKGMWGGLLTTALPFIGEILRIAGVDVSFLNDGLGWNDVPFILTGILSVIGRWRADKKIG